MKYMCLVYLDGENWNSCTDQQCFDYASRITEEGKMTSGAPLYPIETARTVRVRNGQVLKTDGPFAETKEMLAGFYIIDAVDEDEAIKLAAGIPPAKYGSIEIRPVRQLNAS